MSLEAEGTDISAAYKKAVDDGEAASENAQLDAMVTKASDNLVAAKADLAALRSAEANMPKDLSNEAGVVCPLRFRRGN